MTNDSDAEPTEGEVTGCPVCKTHTEEENLASQGLILSGMKALFESDDQTIEAVYSAITQYDGHTAIGLAAALLHDMCLLVGAEPAQFLEGYRQTLNHAQAHGA